MLRAQSETVTTQPKNATSSTTGYENDFACHFLGPSAREARRWAHRMVRPGSIDDSSGRSRSAGLSGKIGHQLHSTCSPGSTRDSTARLGNWRYADSTILLGRAHNQSQSTNSPPSRRQRSTSGGKWRRKKEEPWREFGMNEAGNATGDSAQAHDSVSEAVQGLVDTQFQLDPQARESSGPNVLQNLKEDNVIVTRCPGARSVHLATGAGDLAPNTVVWHLGSRLAWDLSSQTTEERGSLLFGMDGA